MPHKLFASVIALLIVSMPIFAQFPFPETIGKTTDGMQAIRDATRDAQQADTRIWALVGCFGGVLGIAGAYALTPAVLPIKLLGKSPEYVTYYTQTYQQAIINQRPQNAALGCVGGYAAMVVFYLTLLQSQY